jgi:hypothetical protein
VFGTSLDHSKLELQAEGVKQIKVSKKTSDGNVLNIFTNIFKE